MLADDGVDYLEGDRGYRKLTAEFVPDTIDACAEQGLAYLAVHNHGSTTAVGFSATDLVSHERGYPALVDINAGMPVGALVFAEQAVAGDIWASERPARAEPPSHRRPAAAHPHRAADPAQMADPTYDRQTRIFGDRGRAILGGAKVAVVGLGGIGSLISEYLARLGVGELILIDPESLDPTNLSRVVGSRRRDAWPVLNNPNAPGWAQLLGRRLAIHKVRIAAV